LSWLPALPLLVQWPGTRVRPSDLVSLTIQMISNGIHHVTLIISCNLYLACLLFLYW
jgi:hypothetical protein